MLFLQVVNHHNQDNFLQWGHSYDAILHGTHCAYSRRDGQAEFS